MGRGRQRDGRAALPHVHDGRARGARVHGHRARLLRGRRPAHLRLQPLRAHGVRADCQVSALPTLVEKPSKS